MKMMDQKQDGKYIWTQHVKIKMRQYRLTEARVKRIIRYPSRIEEGIMESAVACMQPAGGKHYSEIWTLYVLVRSRMGQSAFAGAPSVVKTLADKSADKVKIISAWRYPGKSPERDPIPPDVLREIRNIL